MTPLSKKSVFMPWNVENTEFLLRYDIYNQSTLPTHLLFILSSEHLPSAVQCQANLLRFENYFQFSAQGIHSFIFNIDYTGWGNNRITP